MADKKEQLKKIFSYRKIGLKSIVLIILWIIIALRRYSLLMRFIKIKNF